MSKVNAKSLSRNFLFASFGEMWRLGSRFILTPLMIRQVGLEGYGTWTLLFSICAYLSMFNASFGTAYSKYTAEYDRSRDYEGLSTIIGSGIATIGGLAFLFMAAVWTLRTHILSYLNVPPILLGDASVALSIVVFCLFLRMSLGCTFDILSGLQRADINYKLNLLGSAVEFCVTLPLLLTKWGLRGLAIGYFSGQIVSTTLAWISCRRICPELHISPMRVSKTGFRQVTALGGRFQILSFLNVIFDQGIKLLLSRLLGVTSVGVYELAYKLLGLGTTISSSLLGPLMPAFANLHAGQETQRARQLFMTSSKTVAVTAGMALAFVAVFADQLVFAWTGSPFPEAAWTLRVLAPSKFLVMMTGVPTASLRGRGTVRLEALFSIVGTTCLLASIFPLYHFAGYRGVVCSRVVEDLGGASWFLWAFCRSERFPLLPLVRDVFGKVVVAIGLAVACVLGGRALFSSSAFTTLPPRWGAVASSVEWGIPFGLVACVACWFLVLTREEAQQLGDIVRRRFATARGSVTTP